jgi:hypothetical protein
MDFFFYVNRKKDVVLHSGQKCNEMQRKGSSCSGIGRECAKILAYCALRSVESSFTAVDKPVDMKEFLSFGLRRFSAISRGEFTIWTTAGGLFKPGFGLSGAVCRLCRSDAPKSRHLSHHSFLLREAPRDSVSIFIDFPNSYTEILIV